jgi:ATP-dependent Clp protease ATP-binding subunit ClpC
VFERFTERAREVIVGAQEDARALNHACIGTEHLLLGLLGVDQGMAAQVLESLQISVTDVRAEVIRIVGLGEDDAASWAQIPFTPRAKKVLDLSWRESRSLGHSYIATEHILLALTGENEGVAARILAGLGVDADTMRTQTLRMLGPPGDRSKHPDQAPPSGAALGKPLPASGAVRELLVSASRIAEDDGRRLIELDDLLTALVRDERTAALRKTLAIDEATIRRAIQDATGQQGDERDDH